MIRIATRLVPLLLPLALLVLPACKHAPPRAGAAAAPMAPEQAPPPLAGHNLLYNAAFDRPRILPWTGDFSKPAEGRAFVDKGELCLEVKNRGANRWDAALRQQHLRLQRGHTYQVQFKMRASQSTRVYLKLGQAGPPYREFWKLLFNVEPTAKVFTGSFTMQAPDDPSVELSFHMGGQLARTTKPPFTVCLDEPHIDDPQFTPVPEPQPPPVPAVLVNQVGYFPSLAKLATVKAPGAVPWELRDAGNQVVARGTTLPFGPDKTSGDAVSVADFSDFTKPGNGYTLAAAGGVSHPFDIRDDLYSKLKYDALAFYYHMRSGIEIAMPYAGEPQWARPAGHVDVPPNKGDKSVPCAPGIGCSYKLDVSGGWYDAGDHGKYVVNAGISVWTLLNWWERLKAFGTSAADFADGKMNIPEQKNRVADLLDEVRWEVEWELKMQVPEGEKLAGMAHHKIHDAKWTQLSTAPHEDPMQRYLMPVSTAATLNLAANAAQASRVWHTIDKDFAARCLAAAERAWVAANAHPDLYAKQGDDGGGPYDDQHLSDELYWAAAELFITTKKPLYREAMTASKHFKEIRFKPADAGGLYTSMTWPDTESLGSISLALVQNGLPKGDIDAIKKQIVAAADAYLEVAHKEGYRVPFTSNDKGYPWGSTSFVMNNGVIMALAHDLTGDGKYLNGVVLAMDYVLGRNALDQSYITGYGDRPLENPYHRFWCHQANERYPKPPPGVLSGGANSGMEDPYIQAAGLQGCAPQKCFIDNGEAWSANEVTINWNAPLAWVAAYLDEKTAGRALGNKAKK